MSTLNIPFGHVRRTLERQSGGFISILRYTYRLTAISKVAVGYPSQSVDGENVG